MGRSAVGEVAFPVAFGVLGPPDAGLDVQTEEACQNRRGEIGGQADQRGVASAAGVDAVRLQPSSERTRVDGLAQCPSGEEQLGGRPGSAGGWSGCAELATG